MAPLWRCKRHNASADRRPLRLSSTKGEEAELSPFEHLNAMYRRLLDEGRRRPDAWTADQFRSFLDFVADSRYLPAWVFATTGCRRGECLGLHWDFDLDAASAIISRQVPTIDHDLRIKGRPALGPNAAVRGAARHKVESGASPALARETGVARRGYALARACEFVLAGVECAGGSERERVVGAHGSSATHAQCRAMVAGRWPLVT